LTVRSGDVTLNKGTKVLWRAPNHQAAKLVMQGDGNLVALDAAGHPVWDSGTEGHAGARLALQGDGNLVVYSVHDVALWASNTSG
jgi:pseudomonalisin